LIYEIAEKGETGFRRSARQFFDLIKRAYWSLQPESLMQKDIPTFTSVSPFASSKIDEECLPLKGEGFEVGTSKLCNTNQPFEVLTNQRPIFAFLTSLI